MLTNGKEIQFWDRERYPPRPIAGFYTHDDLERLRHQRRFAQPMDQLAINQDIAGRDYQNEAIRRVTEGISDAKRKFLLVMATGTGKTRVAIALIDLLLRAKRVQRVLFLADRRELVRQAMGSFKEHLPNESLARIEGGETSGARIQFATYPSMMQVYQRLSVGSFDLIIADESHRSIYQRYKALFDHFDAIQLGLTATPTDYIDHNTFALFDCGDGLPSYYYSYEQAVADDNLVNYRVLDAQTNFQLQGVQGDTLPEALRQMSRDQGVDPDELQFDGSDIERTLINQGTNDAMVREFMDKCRKDARGLPHKTIVFAVSHAHAKRLYQSFNRLFPELQRSGLAEIIDSHMERADETLDDFKYKTFPRVAISIDMLDTGIDVPAIQNLVFAKPVFSKVKFWQMIGRGTSSTIAPLMRLAPLAGLDELQFRVWCERLNLAWLRGDAEEQQRMRERIQSAATSLPDSIPVVHSSAELRAWIASDGFWQHLEHARLDRLQEELAPLMRYRTRSPTRTIEINLPDPIHRRSWIIYGPAGEGAFAESYREQVEALVRRLAGELPELDKLTPAGEAFAD